MTRNILFYKIRHPILIRKMLIKVTLQSTLIKKQLKSIKKPSTTIKNEIKNVSLLLTNTVTKDTLMRLLKRQDQIKLIRPNHREMIIEILKQQKKMELKAISIKKKSKVNSPKQKTKRVYILGDSIIKHVKGHTISSSLDNCKVYV